MNIYLSKVFTRLARRDGLTDVHICQAIVEMNEGLETFAQPHKTTNFVIPAQAGIQYYQALPGFRFSPE